jgi:hypothetical protein
MTVADLNVSRRALLGAACVAPVLGAAAPFRHAGLDPASTFFSWAPVQQGQARAQVRGDAEAAAGAARRERRAVRWQAALARFRKAEAAILAAASSDDEDLYDRLGERFERTLRALLRTAAPDLAALAVKLDLAFAHDVSTLSGGEACLEAVRRDAHWLARAA